MNWGVYEESEGRVSGKCGEILERVWGGIWEIGRRVMEE